MTPAALITPRARLARWAGVALAVLVVSRVQHQFPLQGAAYLAGAAYGLPLVAGLVLGRWGWTAVLAGAGVATLWAASPTWVSAVAATAAAGLAGWRSRRGWPFDPGLGRLADVGRLARLAAEVAAVRGLATAGLAAVAGVGRAGADGLVVGFVDWWLVVLAGAAAGAVRAGVPRPLLAWAPAVVVVGLLLATARPDRRPLTDEPAAVWCLAGAGLAAASLGVLALAAAARERLAESAVRDRLLADLKAVSADLIRRRAVMEALLDQLPVGVLFVDPDGRLVRQNRQYRDVLKLPTDFPALAPPAGRGDSGQWRVARPDGTPVAAADWSVYRAVRAGAAAADRDVRVLCGDGTWREVSVSSAPVSDPDGGGPGSVFVVADQTARRQAERDRRASDERLRQALGSARMYAWEWDPAADRIEVVGGFAEVAGLPGGHPAPASMAEFEALMHPADRAARQALTADLRAGVTADYEVEFRLVRPDGSAAWLATRGRAVLGPDGRPTGRFAGVTFDCSARKRAEERAAAAEAQARFALRAARMIAWEDDLVTGRVTRSDPIEPWLGLPADAPLDAAGYLARIHPDDRARVERELAERLAAGEEFWWDYRIRHADGSWRWVRTRGRGVPGPDGRPAKLAGVHQDVTAEHAAQARLRLLESAVVHARDAVVILDADPADGGGRAVRYANAAFGRMFGYAPDEVAGRSLSFLGGPRSDPQALGRLRAALDAGRPLVAELLNYHRDGSEVWVELSLVPVPDEAGAVSHFVMIQRDVTDRKRAEAAVRESEERLRAIGDSLPDGAVFQYVEDPAGRPSIPYISAGVERLTGVPAADVTADAAALLRLIHPDDRAAHAAAVRRSADRFEPFEFEFRLVPPGRPEAVVYVRSHPNRLAAGGVLWNGVLLDVTDRRRAEEALRRSEERFRGMFENASAGVSELDADGRFTALNPAFAALLGRGPAEVLGRPIADFTHPDHLDALRGQLAEVQDPARTAFRFDNCYRRPDGTAVWTEVSVTVLRDAAGRVRSTLGVSVDVTERRRLEEQLRQAQKMEAVGQLAGGIAHDFNNLLTGVIGHLGLVGLPPGDPGREHLATAERAAQRAAELTQKLLGFARKNQLLLAPVPADACVAEVLDLVRPNLGKGVRLATDLAAAEPVLADPALIGQAVLNLCLNARDAMPAGGTLTVGTAAAAVTPAEAAAHPHARPGRFVRISVADTGTGMTPDVMARVFEPFFTTKGVGKGTGLGLAMVDGIVRQHGGWVAVTSAVGAGTRFDIYLTPAGPPAGSQLVPRALAERVLPDLSDTPAPPPHPGAGASGTVLLVDDEEMIRVLGRSVLEDAGYRVLEAADGAEAVDLFREWHPGIDLVVLDLTMPRMSGQEACRRMAEIRADARVLLSSGYSADDLPDVAGAVGLLAKPYRPAELTAAVRRALGRTVSTG